MGARRSGSPGPWMRSRSFAGRRNGAQRIRPDCSLDSTGKPVSTPPFDLDQDRWRAPVDTPRTGHRGAFGERPCGRESRSSVNGIPDGQLFWIVRNGSPETSMPDFHALSDDQIWRVVLYLRELAK